MLLITTGRHCTVQSASLLATFLSKSNQT